jgi:nucleoside-diphosphate-sugar epimerase
MNAVGRAPRILITGGSGFVGRFAVAALLRQGCEVHLISRRPPSVPAASGVARHAADLRRDDVGALIRAIAPNAILHLAWCAEPGKFWNDPANLDWVAASLRLARAAAEAGARRFVGVGTCYEYDWPRDAPCHETRTPLANHTVYDAAKAGLAAILTSYFAEVGVGFAWARLFHLFGPGEDARRFASSVARALLRGEPALCTRGTPVRDFLDARDAGDALAALVASDYCGAVNIASGAPVRLAEIAETLADLAGRRDLLRLGALPDRPGDPPFLVADVGLMKEKIGFAPRFDLKTGLRAVLADWTEREGGDERK